MIELGVSRSVLGAKDEGEGPNQPVRAEGEEGLIMTHFWLRDWPRGQKE